jgi:hypothetical protein
VRTLLASLITSGGMVALIAFFLPWVAVSCNGNTLGSVSPYERATGIELTQTGPEADVSVQVGSADTTLAAQPGYWLVLLIAGATLGLGVAASLRHYSKVQQTGALAAATAAIGLTVTLKLGVGETLGIMMPTEAGPGIALDVSLALGLWLSIAGYALALSGGIATLVLGGRIGPLD